MKVESRVAKITAGLWIDHREAVMVFLSPQGEEIKKIQSNTEKHASHTEVGQSTNLHDDQPLSADDRRQNSFTGHLNHYYDEVLACINRAQSILIFGPGEAKDELKKRIEKHGLSQRIALVETADKMTEHQIAAKVRNYFQE